MRRRCIRRENTKRCKSNASAIIHTDAKSLGVIASITTVAEIKSTFCLDESMFIGYGIIKKGDVVDVLPYTSPGNNISAGTGWAKKVDKCYNRSLTISVKLDVDIFLYHNKQLKSCG